MKKDYENDNKKNRFHQNGRDKRKVPVRILKIRSTAKKLISKNKS